MKSNKAFTLIEILVVVLIIGILAAIAVPKYQKAVKLSRVKSILPIIRSIYEAQERYYLANNKYTKEIEDLDINVEYIIKEDVNEGKNRYVTSWGNIAMLNFTKTMFVSVGNISIDYYGPENGVCYNDNDICSQFGGRIITPASGHDSGTNVYYVDNW